MPSQAASRCAVLVVGDTAGHVYPALAVAEAFRERHPAVDVLFVGASGSIAAGILSRESARFVAVPGAPLRRVAWTARLRALPTIGRTTYIARRLLGEHRATLVIGFGGFVTGGVLLAARSLGLATAIHEANVDPGLANVLLRPLVHRVFVADEHSTLRGTVVGVPIRNAISSLWGAHRQPPDGVLRVLVTTGSRGARFLMHLLPEALRRTAAGVRVEVRQQVGMEDATALAQRYTELGIRATLSPFFDDMRGAYEWAHVAVARGGANTLAELAVAGIPTAVIPLVDAAADHQAPNATRWAAAGAGPAIEESPAALGPLAAWLTAVGTSVDTWCRARESARSLARPDAAIRLVDACAGIDGARR